MVREISHERFERATELYRQIDGLRTKLCRGLSLPLSEKIEIKRQMQALNTERRRVLGVET